MNVDSGNGNSGFAMVEVARSYRFGIAYGLESTADSDPVADQYRAGSLGHLRTLIDVALATLAPGDRVLDLGAHLGGFALTAAAIGCEVLAVEASPRNADLLRLSAVHNGFEQLEVVQAVVSDHCGSVEFSALGPFGHVATPTTGFPAVSVPAVTVDELLEQRQWDNVRFIKMDVEGSEVSAVRGMQRLLQGSKSPIIFFESNKHTLGFYGLTEEDLKAELWRFGYVVYAVRRGKLRRVYEGVPQSATVTDYLAAKRLTPCLAKWEKSANSLLARLGRILGLSRRNT